MALSCSLILNTFGGLDVPLAYVRVTKAETYKANVAEPGQPRDERMHVKYAHAVYLSGQARLDGSAPLDTGAGFFEWDEAAGILSACYAHLKSQDAFAAATDC